MNDIFNYFFGPVDKIYCNLYLIFTITSLLVLIWVFSMEIYLIIKNRKALKFSMVRNGVLLLVNMFVVYILNRIMYNMCMKTML